MINEVLDNGVTVVLKENHFTQAVAIQAWVGAGSLHEQPDERGMAHFLEHMLFKGTERRAVGEIAASVEACGGEINAYTTFDHTVFHLTLAAPHAAVGIDLLCDAFGHSKLDAAEMEREREVILEEIRRGNDSPGGRVGRRVFELVFAGTEAGRPIIGSEASVRSFSRDALAAFYQRWYQPGNLTVVIAGAIDAAKALELVRATFGSLAAGPVQAQPVFRTAPAVTLADDAWPVVSILRGDFQQPRIEVVYPAPPLENFDATALDLAAFAMGSGEMSRLNRRLRDGDGSVTSVGASVYSPTFGGLFEMSALTTLDSVKAAVQSLAREVACLRGSESVTPEELRRARANLKADRRFQEETVDGQARSLGFGMRTPSKLLYDDVYTTLINEMPDVAVDAAVRRWLRPEAATVVVLLPDAHPLTEGEVRAAFRNGVAAGLALAPAVKAVRSRPASRSRDGEVVRLGDGLTLIHRYNPAVELFTLTAATEGGQRAETASTAGLSNALADMLAMASETHSYEALIGAVEGVGASLGGFSGKDSLGLSLQCLTEHAPEMLALFRDCLLRPVLPQEQWDSLSRELIQALQTQNDSPASIAARQFRELLFGDHPYRYPLIGTEEALAEMGPATLLAAYQRILTTGPWVLAVASTLPMSQVVDLLAPTFAGFKPRAERRHFPSDQLIGHAIPKRIHIVKEREQSHVVFGFPGLTWGDPDRAALDVLVNVLGGHGGRLFRTLRDRDSLAYVVSPIISYGCHPGLIGSYIACAPDKAERALAALEVEMLALAEASPSEAEVDRARNHIIGTHDMSLQKSDSQTSTMALMELYGYGFDDFLAYPKAIAKVAPGDVRRVAKRLFLRENAAAVTVGPVVAAT